MFLCNFLKSEWASVSDAANHCDASTLHYDINAAWSNWRPAGHIRPETPCNWHL
jgi:hypothetical protein